jgi:hypothetical protein
LKPEEGLQFLDIFGIFRPAYSTLFKKDLNISKATLRFRQIHLDFHTSEAIAGIGERFDPDHFADTLAKASVDSITCFGRCHHGWIYYETEKFRDRMHPHLTRNLLKEQIEACHARDIRVPIYLTVQWDQYTSERHPEWLAIDASGKQTGTPPYEPGFYRRLAVNSGYYDFLKAHVADLFALLPVDGLFFDIVQPLDDSSYFSRTQMLERGLNPSSGEDRQAFGLETINAFKSDMSAFIRSFDKDSAIFYNAGHIGPRHRSVAAAYSHFELESLPSGGWGYVHFPMAVRYARGLGLDCMGMTGKFHTSWGDFHSFKNPEALQYECFQMLAQGARCSIGDQLLPHGEICQPTYELIGSVYSEIKAKEPWCVGAVPQVDMALMTTEEFSGERIPTPVAGAVRLLQELGHQFDIVDSLSDFSQYKVVILPDEVPVSDDFSEKLKAYVTGGGSVVASYKSGLNASGDAFALDVLGVEFKGEALYSPDFLMPGDQISEGLSQTEHVMYLKGLEVASKSEVLAETIVPYFNRTWEHFCSHRHTPSSGGVGYPGIVRNGQNVYFMHPVFSQYAINAPRWVKQLVKNVLGLVLPDPVLILKAPSTTLVTVNAQPDENRWVVHLLHYIPERRGQEFDVIEDVIPIFDVGVSVRVDETVSGVATAPSGQALVFEQSDGRVSFTVPKVEGHEMVVLSF